LVAITWHDAHRIINSRYPFTAIFDRVADPSDLDAILELEARTNPRVRDELGEISLVRVEDRVSGPGTTPVMASFTHTKASRFSDGTYGVYYAAAARDTAIAETVFHLARWYRLTNEQSTDVDFRDYVATIAGRFEDIRKRNASDPIYDTDSYVTSQAFAAALHANNVADGIVYRSVRDGQHRHSIACFRPRNISGCRTESYLTYRWDGREQRVTDVWTREHLAGF